MFPVLLFILGILADVFFPVWWSFVPIAAVTAYFFARSSGYAFWRGFLAIGLAWALLILIRSVPNHNILARRMAAFFYLPNWIVLILLTSSLAGLMGGLSSYCGYLLKQAFNKRNV